jgi:hypothetical protein
MMVVAALRLNSPWWWMMDTGWGMIFCMRVWKSLREFGQYALIIHYLYPERRREMDERKKRKGKRIDSTAWVM